MSKVERSPAITRRHPAESLPERPARQTRLSAPTQAAQSTVDEIPPAAATSQVAPPPVATPLAAPQPSPGLSEGEEKLTEQHNVRIRPSVKARAVRAVSKLRYETGDKHISLQSITDAALDEYLTKRGC